MWSGFSFYQRKFDKFAFLFRGFHFEFKKILEFLTFNIEEGYKNQRFIFT